DQVYVGQCQGEGCDAEDGEPDDGLAADLVADRATQERACGDGAEKQEQVYLRIGNRHVEFLNQVKREIAGETGHVEVFGKHQQCQHRQGKGHAPAGQSVGGLAALFEREQVQMIAVPAAQTV